MIPKAYLFHFNKSEKCGLGREIRIRYEIRNRALVSPHHGGRIFHLVKTPIKNEGQARPRQYDGTCIYDTATRIEYIKRTFVLLGILMDSHCNITVKVFGVGH